MYRWSSNRNMEERRKRSGDGQMQMRMLLLEGKCHCWGSKGDSVGLKVKVSEGVLDKW